MSVVVTEHVPVLTHVISFQPHLHEIVNRSMELACTSKEPYNYFLLLRALFRSIGGGKLCNHYQINQFSE